jgi:NAD(P)-dependent dehydrogenase (short-subunit alcohol dehydrogenase family)
LRAVQAAARDIEHAGGTALALPVDVADGDAVDEAAERIEAELGPIDVWVNVAFTSVFARFVDIRPEEFARVTEVRFRAWHAHGPAPHAPA